LLEVAQAVGTDTGNLSRIERGSQTPSGELAARLHNYYGGEVDWPEIMNIRRTSADDPPPPPDRRSGADRRQSANRRAEESPGRRQGDDRRAAERRRGEEETDAA
jgi:transcriptional regulator with XRE-family HTH domain